MNKSDDFIDAFVDFIQTYDDTNDAVVLLKGELRAANFNPSDHLVSLITPIDDEIDPEVEEEVLDDDVDEEDDDELYWEDEDEEEED